MITREMQSGEEVYAILEDDDKADCDKCCFAQQNNKCVNASCIPSRRTDSNYVYFRPLSDLRAATQFANQQKASRRALKLRNKP